MAGGFHNGDLSQMIVCGENQEITEVPGKMLADSLLYLIAAYYVYGVAYPKGCRALLHFFSGHPYEEPTSNCALVSFPCFHVGT